MLRPQRSVRLRQRSSCAEYVSRVRQIMTLHRSLHEWLRRAALAAIVVLGIGSIIGSGGGIELPSDCPPGSDCSAPPPVLSVAVRPLYATALVGTAVTYAATASDATGAVSYQWSRSADGGVSFVDIPGATAAAYTLAAANLGDDGAIFRVTARDATPYVAQAWGRLAVSATPGLVFRDTEFSAADWTATPVAFGSAPAPEHSEESPASGGNPGAFRRMVIQIPPQSGVGRVFYTSLVAAYDPATQGAIRLIDYAEDGISLQPNVSTSTDSAMLLEQAGRHYVANQRNDATSFILTSWSSNQSRASLRAVDFGLLDGPPCETGERCPDFSTQGAPMRFGYWRFSFGTQGDRIAHGIDNWQVTVWRQ